MCPTTDLDNVVNSLINDTQQDGNVTNDELWQLQELDTTHEDEGTLDIPDGEEYEIIYADYNDDSTWTIHVLNVDKDEANEIINELDDVAIIKGDDIEQYIWINAYDNTEQVDVRPYYLVNGDSSYSIYALQDDRTYSFDWEFYWWR